MGIDRKEVKRNEDSIDCRLCGKPFENLISLSRHIKRSHSNVSTEDYYNLYLKTNNADGFCKICQKPTKFIDLQTGYKDTCCKTCTNIFKYGFSSPFCHQETHSKSRQTKLKRYGDTKYLNVEKQKETMLKKYGGTGLASPEIRKRIEETNLDRFGSKSPLGSKEIQDKIKNTNLDKYGVENVFSSDEIKEKIKETNLATFGFENAMMSEEVKNKVRNTLEQEYGGIGYASEIIREKSILTRNENLREYINNNDLVLISSLEIKYPDVSLRDIKIHEYQNSHLISKEDMHKALTKDEELKKVGYLSKYEVELHEWLKSIYSGSILLNSKIPDSSLELDFYLPDKKLAIEFNGNFYHSTNSGKSFDYHLNKTLRCQEKGIRLIHIFEYEWDHKKDICKSFLASLLGTYEHAINSNLCKIQDISISVANEFLKNNNILLNLKQFNYSCGLFYNNELVYVWCFEKYQKNYNLIYSCSKLYTKVDNTISMISNYLDFESLTSFVDLSKFTIDEYTENDFKLLKNLEPVNVCYKNGEVQFKENIKNFDPTLWLQISNCGYSKVRRKVK